VNPAEVSASLQRYSILLNDPRSPVHSAIESLAQYKGDKGVMSFGKMFRDLDDFVTNRIDIEGLEREQRQLEALNDQMQLAQGSLRSIQAYLVKEQQEVLGSAPGFSEWNDAKTQ